MLDVRGDVLRPPHDTTPANTRVVFELATYIVPDSPDVNAVFTFSEAKNEAKHTLAYTGVGLEVKN